MRFEDYVAAMVAGVDVRVNVEREGNQREIQRRFPPAPSDRETWLRTLGVRRLRSKTRARTED